MSLINQGAAVCVRDVTFRARRVTYRARHITFRARRITFRARRITFRARRVTFRARRVTYGAACSNRLFPSIYASVDGSSSSVEDRSRYPTRGSANTWLESGSIALARRGWSAPRHLRARRWLIPFESEKGSIRTYAGVDTFCDAG